MDKQALLSAIPASPEERLMLAGVLDKWENGMRKNIPTCTRFLTEQEQGLIERMMIRAGGKLHFFGGYDGAERRVAVFLPDYLDEAQIDFELCALKVIRCLQDRYHAPLSHRDYLGSLMAMGITRDTVGDILIGAQSADLIVTESAASLILSGLVSVGRCRVDAEEVDPKTLHVPVIEYEMFSDTVASLRLDCLIAAAFRLSREEATRAVRGGRVQVGGRDTEKPDAEVKEGEKLTLRGGGKVILAQVGGMSKKGRLRVTFKRPK